MITGRVTPSPELQVSVRLRGPGGNDTAEDAVIDTGFDGQLLLPDNVIGYLNLNFVRVSKLRLVDGSIGNAALYEADIEWNGVWRSLIAWGLGKQVLIGMKLLTGYRLTADIVPGGLVQLEPLP